MPSSPRAAAHKVVSQAALLRAAARARTKKRTIVFTNGCFDLLHAGHVALLERARQLGDLLVVGINSDRSARALKGAGRPVIGQRDRARLLAAMESVDYVTVFQEATPARLVSRLRPHVLIKGADWTASKIVGRDVVRKHGGRVIRVPLRKGLSTTSLISRIRRGAR